MNILILTLFITSLLSLYKIYKLKKKVYNLQNNREYFKSFLDSTCGISVISTDENGIIKTFNRGAEELLLYKSEDVINKLTPMNFHDKTEVEKRSYYLSKKLHKSIKGFETFVAYSKITGFDNREWIYIQKNGNHILVDLTVSPILGKNNELLGYVGIAKSINKRLEYEKELKDTIKIIKRKSNEKSKQIVSLNNELKAISYNLTHDIKTPLRGINQLAFMLKEDFKQILTPEILELLSLLSQRIERIDGVVNSILDYTRIRAFLKKSTKTNLNILLKNLIEFIKVPDSIKITIENELPTLEIDKNYIEVVFHNIISNSIRYMDKPDGIITISATKKDKFWYFKIFDNGPGIDEKYHSQIFQMFQSLNTNYTLENLGVGLSISKKIIELHGGEIFIDSKPNEGTSIIFTLPVLKN